MIDFPSGASVGATYAVGGRVWTWDGRGWARVSNLGQSVTIFVGIVGVQIYAGPFEGAQLYPVFPGFTQLNYV